MLVVLGLVPLACHTQEPVVPGAPPPHASVDGARPTPAATTDPAPPATVDPAPVAPAPAASATSPTPGRPRKSDRVACELEPIGRGKTLVGCGATHEEACRAAIDSVDDAKDIYRVDGLVVRDLLNALTSDAWQPPAEVEHATCRVELDLHAKGANGKGYGADRAAAKESAHRDACRKLPGRCRPGVDSEVVLCGESPDEDKPGQYQCLVHLHGPKLGSRDITRSSEHGWTDACRHAHEVAAKGAPEVAIRHIDGIPHATMYAGLVLGMLSSLGGDGSMGGSLSDVGGRAPCQ